MVLLVIEHNWPWFFLFVGCVLTIAVIVILLERKYGDDEILEENPLIIIRNILLNQVIFYLIYLYVMFTVDITSFEIFRWYQVFTSAEISFFTSRGLYTGLGYILSMLTVSISLTAVVRNYNNMLDYCFTLFVFHFIIVSIVENDFPTNGSWWVASGAGLILMMFFSERLCYNLETMSYQATLNGKIKKEEKIMKLDHNRIELQDKSQKKDKDESESEKDETPNQQDLKKDPEDKIKSIDFSKSTDSLVDKEEEKVLQDKEQTTESNTESHSDSTDT